MCANFVRNPADNNILSSLFVVLFTVGLRILSAPLRTKIMCYITNSVHNCIRILSAQIVCTFCPRPCIQYTANSVYTRVDKLCVRYTRNPSAPNCIQNYVSHIVNSVRPLVDNCAVNSVCNSVDKMCCLQQFNFLPDRDIEALDILGTYKKVDTLRGHCEILIKRKILLSSIIATKEIEIVANLLYRIVNGNCHTKYGWLLVRNCTTKKDCQFCKEKVISYKPSLIYKVPNTFVCNCRTKKIPDSVDNFCGHICTEWCTELYEWSL